MRLRFRKAEQRPVEQAQVKRSFFRRRKKKEGPASGRKLAADFLATLEPVSLPKRKGFRTPWLPVELRQQFAADHQARAQAKRNRRCQRRIGEALAGGWGPEAQARMEKVVLNG